MYRKWVAIASVHHVHCLAGILFISVCVCVCVCVSGTRSSPPLDHDDYGFKILPDYEVEDMKLLAKIQALEIRSHNLLYQVRIQSRPFWTA